MAKAKIKTAYFCQNCGAESPKWLGKCPACGQWNTYVEEVVDSTPKSQTVAWTGEVKGSGSNNRAAKPLKIKEIEHQTEKRFNSKDAELNRVLGGGVVPGALVLIGGEPGIGKSTLMLQVALKMNNKKVLYVSGEESQSQIKMRSDRMAHNSDNCYVLTEVTTQKIFKQIELLKPEVLVIDSIQTLQSEYIDSSAGSVSQVKQTAAELMKFAKESAVPTFIIGHINKDGNIAGPKVLEHMVDTVLQFEGDRHGSYRILRTTKNRFGSTSELGIYEMQHNGLREVSNPSEILLSQREEALSGVAIGATLEGNRPLLIEVQSLVSAAAYGNPQRSSTGYDVRRMNMLLAVLEKRGGFRLGVQDVFLNIAGGIKIEDPAIDLAMCVSLISSYEEMNVPDKTCFAAEVGLGGELRAVNHVESRISEAQKLGFEQIYLSKYALKGIDMSKYSISIRAYAKLYEVFQDLFG
ncbi:DNA repair protein RadA [Aureibacter tunicatorum]|uniref:DNA repair protein RadA n=1 Tax=Aureibacter tunicatorum TaxID=866807 RepID=A0AAE3XKR0_9BACT|nr:DNA repair protein RadA [Aureibacter tunicatorum]MDR6237794.1 DNA repair protein RadA/Sms [Aureibacter tunicatorum]BDD02829.1 DNA repair protein RadA [Aureibacter tunicatorum]